MTELNESFPKLGISTQELIDHIEGLIEQSSASKDEMGAVNWGDIGVKEIQYRLSMLNPQDGPWCVVTVEEASPDCKLGSWLNEKLDRNRFPKTFIECEW